MKQQVDLDELREYVADTYNRAIRNAERERVAQMKVLDWIADQIVSQIQVSESDGHDPDVSTRLDVVRSIGGRKEPNP